MTETLDVAVVSPTRCCYYNNLRLIPLLLLPSFVLLFFQTTQGCAAFIAVVPNSQRATRHNQSFTPRHFQSLLSSSQVVKPSTTTKEDSWSTSRLFSLEPRSLSNYYSSVSSSSSSSGSSMDKNTTTTTTSDGASATKVKPTTSSSSSEKEASAIPLATLCIHGPDSRGIVAAFSQLLYGHGCNIVDAEQSTDHASELFFQRIQFDYHSMHTDRHTLETGLAEVCERWKMNYTLNWGMQKKRVAIMVSKYDHCLWELLLRHRAGELDCDIVCLLSNHDTLKPVADAFDVPFHVFAITKATKAEQEGKELDLLQKEYEVDLVILARYMQIVSDNFCQTFANRIINIHHSFLPAFMGGRPYHRAHARGVKLIGATAHYATADLDEGPIIEQDIVRISHRDAVADLLRKGRTLEKNVLVRAVKAHLEDRILVYDNKCVVFGE